MSAIEALQKYAEKTGKTPQALIDEPELTTTQEQFWKVFSILHHRRQAGFTAPQRLQLSEIEIASRCFHLPLGEAIVIFSELDTLYMDWWVANNKRK